MAKMSHRYQGGHSGSSGAKTYNSTAGYRAGVGKEKPVSTPKAAGAKVKMSRIDGQNGMKKSRKRSGYKSMGHSYS